MALTIKRAKLAGLIKDSTFKPGDNYFAETKIQARLEGQAVAAPKYVWGIVKPTKSKLRHNPPPIEIYPTKSSWLDIGHIMALQLGGSDNQQNLIPQYRETNQHGKWADDEGRLAEEAMKQWKNNKRYLFAVFTTNYGTSGLIPDSVRVDVFSIKSADFPSNDPDKVETWRESPHPKLEEISHTIYPNKLTDRDLINTGMKSVQHSDNSDWEQFQLGSMFETINKSSLPEPKKKMAKARFYDTLFSTGGMPPSKPQKAKADAALQTFKSATEQTMVSAAKQQRLEQVEAYKSGESDEVPGSGLKLPLSEYTKQFSRSGMMRRMNSMDSQPKKKQKIAELKTKLKGILEGDLT